MLGFFCFQEGHLINYGLKSHLESSLFLKQILPDAVILKQPGEHQQLLVLNAYI